MTPTLIFSVGTYLKFEIAHNYRAGGSNSVYWTLKQYNLPAEVPMIMRLYSGLEVFVYALQHIQKEIQAYSFPNNMNVNIHIRIENGNELAYEGLHTCLIDNKGFADVTGCIDRFWPTFDLFKYMVTDSPI